jgi:hypothetical protein
MGTRNQVGIGLWYRPASLCSLATQFQTVPPHRVEFVKKLPVIMFPTAWNSAPGYKTNPVQHLYLRELKSLLLAAIPP